jgi:hypothetical protein
MLAGAVMVGVLAVGTPNAMAAVPAGTTEMAGPGPAPIRNLGLGSQPQVATNPDGDAAMVWAAYRRAHDDIVIKAMYRPHGGHWSDPEIVSQRGRTLQTPDVAVDAAGTAIVVWETGNAYRKLFVSTRPAGGHWRQPHLFRETTWHHIAYPRVVAGGRGNVAISWTEWTIDEDDDDWPYGYSNVFAAVKRPDHAWDDPAVVRQNVRDVNVAPVVAMRSNGTTTLAWSESVDGIETVQAATWFARSHTWRSPATITTTGDHLSQVAIAIDGGRVITTWFANGLVDADSMRDNTLYAASRTAGQHWDEPQALDSYFGPTAYYQPRAGAGNGTAAVSWMRRSDDDDPKLVVVASNPDGSWGEPEIVASAADFGPRDAFFERASDWPILIDRAGRVVMTWVAVDARTRYQWWFARRSAHVGWGPPSRFGRVAENIYDGTTGRTPDRGVFAAWVAEQAPKTRSKLYFLPRA